MGIIETYKAISLAEEKGLDLVEISPRAQPPVCKVMDYGRYKYELAKKQRIAKMSSSTVELKEIKFRPKTEGHDMDFKIRHIRKFLEEGNKCRLVIAFRGREIVHPETGMAVLKKVIEATEDLSEVEQRPNLEGKKMAMILAPKATVLRQRSQAVRERAKSMQRSMNNGEPGSRSDDSVRAEKTADKGKKSAPVDAASAEKNAKA